MNIFDISPEKMKETSSTFTLTEIHQQPSTWKKTCAQIAACKEELQAFLDQVLKAEDFDIVLTGAGTSEFVGNSLYQALNRKYGYKVKSYATTDIVPSPEDFLSRTKPTILVSFGRSGNSPETIGAVDAAEVVCQNLYHLFVTCNHEGSLSKMAKDREHCYALNLTPETHDQSFAMTSSFSNMYMATYLAFNLDRLEEITAAIDKVCAAGTDFLEEGFTLAREIVDGFDFNRIVYLGNVALKGVSQESALKMLELTAGQVATMYDSPLGFRHGPKSIIDDRTLTVVYLSDDEYRRKYELDLIKEMSPQRKKNRIAAVMNTPCEEAKNLVDYTLEFGVGQPLENVLLGFDFILFAQTLAVLKSLSLGITPDNPCPTGEVNRVVKGVTLYPYILK
ncbi:MAG: SIS domain-containing protein [Lachnospiraceae bacterium]|jgi:tagatose-6-phosphate ketose/aldose isomerase|nr:SIS domain-containing protein [Lachnospiraceae bacterium]MCI9681542.1 SIS domain-containing protein [Lachnospiraceae bacterium]